MDTFITLQQIDQAADFVRGRTRHQPSIGIILGSGLGALADSVENPDVIPYHDVPNWPASTVPGHAGRLVIGQLEGRTVLVMQGRVHYYEGYRMDEVTFPVRVMQRLGIGTLIVTNAAGGINQNFRAGDVMLIRDHVSWIAMAGLNPLRGPNFDEIGERFPDMSQPYDHELRAMARKVAKEQGVRVHEGVYFCLAGPSFETPADLRFLLGIGADAVGMSTVPEVIVARHGRVRVLGISGITNESNLEGTAETTHEEVLKVGQELGPRIGGIVRGVLRQIG